LRHDGVFGFYPVVPDSSWVARLLALGARTVQLRVKEAEEARVREQVEEAVALGRSYRAQVVINDHWRIALEAGADYLHLGQGDLEGADGKRLRESGIELGVSTHDAAELRRALDWPAAYIALGPIYETTLKKMPWAPQGLGRLAEWKARLRCPLVAIGGITLERAPAVLEAGADLVAVVGDVVNQARPEERATAWLRMFEARAATPVAARSTSA
jgi:thiamine-phosphate pyrophosphorylase